MQKPKPQKKLGKKPSALTNLGQTCYLNVILQMMYFNPILLRYTSAEQGATALIKNLKLFATLSQSSVQIDPKFVLAKLAAHISKSRGAVFIPNTQQDVPEVLGYILDDIMQVPTVPSNLFTSSVRTCTTCNTCGNYFLTEENQHIIKLQVSESIIASLSIFLKEEAFSSQNLWSCGSCNGLRQSSRRSYFVRTPTILFIQLMRFCTDRENNIVKLNGLVRENRRLSIWEEDGDGVSVRIMYKLTSIVSHSGNYGSGHYTAQGCDDPSGDIYHCNDTDISKVSTFDMRDVYMLTYRKI